MSANNNNKAENDLKNTNNSHTLYNIIQNKRQSSRNHISNSFNSSNGHLNLNMDDVLSNTSAFHLNRPNSPCLPNFGSLNKEANLTNKMEAENDDMKLPDVGQKKKNSITEVFEGNLLVQHEWLTDEDDDSDCISNAAICKKSCESNDKKPWINIDPNHLSGINDTQNKVFLKLDTSTQSDESDTLSDYNSACEVKNVLKNNLNYLKLNKEILYNKYSNINKREDKRIKLGMGYSSYRKKIKTFEYKTKEDFLGDELKYKKAKMFSLSVAKKSCNFKRNRYTDISPYNYNRVSLNVQEDESGSLSNDYINATKVVLDTIDPQNPEILIATQGPTKHTYNQFWQMVYDQALGTEEIIVVMVTPLVEGGREKCFPYWPSKQTSKYSQWDKTTNLIPQKQSVGQSSSIFHQDLNLRVLKDEEEISTHYYTVLELESMKNKNHKVKVHHLYYDKWADFSSPTSIPQIIDLIKHTNTLRKTQDMKIISHCSAGVGRTGTFFALYYLYNSFMNKSLTSNLLSDPVESTVSQLRKCRMKMVQTFEQYKFIYEVVRHLYDQEDK